MAKATNVTTDGLHSPEWAVHFPPGGTVDIPDAAASEFVGNPSLVVVDDAGNPWPRPEPADEPAATEEA